MVIITQINPTTTPTTTKIFNLINLTNNLILNERKQKEEEEQEIILPPQHLFSDYIEIAYLGLVIFTGLTLNFCVLKRLLIEKKMTERGGKQKNGFILLKLNLNISDLLILLIHALGKLSWLITYEWKGGECLCRIFNFLSMFTLYLSSNIVICIALDRLSTVLNAKKLNIGQKKLNFVRIMLIFAWLFSIIFSLPQLFVWTTYNPFKNSESKGWVQCTDIWSIDRYEHYLEQQQNEKILQKNNNKWREFILSPIIQNSYELTHLFLVFYGPLIALIICYALITTRLIRFAANNPRNKPLQIPQQQQQNCGFIVNNDILNNNKINNWKRRCSSKRSSVKSFPSIKLYYHLNENNNKDCCHQPVLLPTVEKLTYSNEDSEINKNNNNCYEGSPNKSSSNSLNNKIKQTTILDLNENNLIKKCCNCRNSISTNSSFNNNLFFKNKIIENDNNEIKISSAKRIFFRIKNSFNLKFSKGQRLLIPNNINNNLNCSGTSWEEVNKIGEEEEEENEIEREDKGQNSSNSICEEFSVYRPISASLGQHYIPRYRQKRINSNEWSILKKQQTNQQQQCLCSEKHKRNCSVRSSSISTIIGINNKTTTTTTTSLWRKHLKSRAFKTTLLVILFHILLWSPYNVYALMKHCNEQIYEKLSEQANVLKDLQFLIVLINPFLYGFGTKNIKGKGGNNTNNQQQQQNTQNS